MTGHEIGRASEPRVFPDELALDREVFVLVAQTHPGVIRTLRVLLGELSALDGLAPELARALGQHLCRVGETVIRRADRDEGGIGR